MRMGYPNIEIRVYPTYDNYLQERYVDVSNSFLKFNLRENLRGLLTASLLVLDSNNIIEDTSENIFRIVITNNINDERREFILGTTHNDLTILQDGSPARNYNLVPYHNKSPRKFCRRLTNSSIDSMNDMLDTLYTDVPMLRPTIEAPNPSNDEVLTDGAKTIPDAIALSNVDAYLPSAVWVKSFDKYMTFVSDKGLSLENDNFVFCWYDADEIKIVDYETILGQVPLKGIFAEEKMVGMLADMYDLDIPVFKYEFMTESNPYNRDYNKNSFYVSTSNEKNGAYATIIGSGENFIPIDRSGTYREMTYANGYEEMFKNSILNQYDIYAKFRGYGDTRLKPGAIMEIEDELNLIKNIQIIDEVLHEFSQDFYYSHVFLLSHSKDIEEFEIDQELNDSGINYPVDNYEEPKYNNGNLTKEAKNPNTLGIEGLFDDHDFDLDGEEWGEERFEKH